MGTVSAAEADADAEADAGIVVNADGGNAVAGGC